MLQYYQFYQNWPISFKEACRTTEAGAPWSATLQWGVSQEVAVANSINWQQILWFVPFECDREKICSVSCWNCLPIPNILYGLLAQWICQMHPVGLRQKYVPALSAPAALLHSSVSIFCLLCLPETKPWFVLISLVEIHYQCWWQIAPFKFFSSKSYFWHIVTAHKLISQNKKITIRHEQTQGDQHILKIKVLWAAWESV